MLLPSKAKGLFGDFKDDSGDATSIQLFDDPNIIVNMSVWETADFSKTLCFALS